VVESRHRVHAAIFDESGRSLGSAGDIALVTIWRSCAKPFQVMSFVRAGHVDALDWGADEIALACASHGGEPEHVALARAMLETVDLEEGDLVCGPHDPLSRRGMRLVQQSGEAPTRLHNNCSGKHAAMLAYARREGWPTLGYESCVHPVQQHALESIAHWCGIPTSRLVQTTDGCGVIAVGTPLDAIARAFARLGAAAARGDEVPARVLGAMRARPFLVGGTDRFDSVLIEETDGRVISKVGAEGVHAATVPERGIGFAIKVADGATRAQHPAVLRLLQLLDILPSTLPPRLASFLRTPVVNTRGATVGEVRPAV
jgi:L-asparaginase II